MLAHGHLSDLAAGDWFLSGTSGELMQVWCTNLHEIKMLWCWRTVYLHYGDTQGPSRVIWAMDQCHILHGSVQHPASRLLTLV